MTRFLPFLAWLPLLCNRSVLRTDILAGLTGAIVVLPQGVAFATLAGMPPAYGLYSAMVPCVIAALFGSKLRARLACVVELARERLCEVRSQHDQAFG